jgi:hypothetical protein
MVDGGGGAITIVSEGNRTTSPEADVGISVISRVVAEADTGVSVISRVVAEADTGISVISRVLGGIADVSSICYKL